MTTSRRVDACFVSTVLHFVDVMFSDSRVLHLYACEVNNTESFLQADRQCTMNQELVIDMVCIDGCLITASNKGCGHIILN